MPKKRQLNTIIDKLTRSIENALSGDCFKTEVLRVDSKDIKNLVSKDWLFKQTKYKCDDKGNKRG